jgi:hypothetical protein
MNGVLVDRVATTLNTWVWIRVILRISYIG